VTSGGKGGNFNTDGLADGGATPGNSSEEGWLDDVMGAGDVHAKVRLEDAEEPYKAPMMIFRRKLSGIVGRTFTCTGMADEALDSLWRRLTAWRRRAFRDFRNVILLVSMLFFSVLELLMPLSLPLPLPLPLLLLLLLLLLLPRAAHARDAADKRSSPRAPG